MKIYRLKELKTNQLRKLYLNGNITEDQFNKADEFFKKHSAYEKEIDWNRGLKITWEELEKVIKKERNSKSQIKNKIRKGLEGFEEGKDYLVLEETSDYVAYQPFNWKSSRMIASHYVEPSKNEYGQIKDAEWCTAYQKDSDYWDIHNKIEAFVYICGESIPTKKVAISISKKEKDANESEFLYSSGDLNFNIWDFNNHKYTIKKDELLKVVPDLYSLIEKAYFNWENKLRTIDLSKLKLNPQTNRYDYEGNLDKVDLEGLISKDGNGFTINFGTVTGNFDCSNLNLTSLKGSPQIVGGNFICYWNYLTSLEGAPHTVEGSFNCFGNLITSLEGAPQTVRENFNCSHNRLTSLKGSPKEVGGDFDCEGNYELNSLDGIRKVKGKIYKSF